MRPGRSRHAIGIWSAAVFLAVAVGLYAVVSHYAESSSWGARRDPMMAFDPSTAPVPLVLVHPGTFRMGSDNGDADELPVRMVTIARAFYIGQTEVTAAQYTELMDPRGISGRFEARAPRRVGCESAVEFCRRLTESQRNKGQLPEGLATDCRPRRNGNTAAARAGTPSTPPVTIRKCSEHRHGSTETRAMKFTWSGRKPGMHGASTICWATRGNGAATGTRRNTILTTRLTPRGPRQAAGT